MNDKDKARDIAFSKSEDEKRKHLEQLYYWNTKKALKKQFDEHEIEFDIGYSHIMGERVPRKGRALKAYRKELCEICNKDLALEWSKYLDIWKTGLCEKCKEKGLLPDVSFEGDYISWEERRWNR